MTLDVFDFYNKMERNDIMLSFKGDVTSELLTSILQIMEAKLENMDEKPKVKRKVYNVLVECLQNLYHHRDEAQSIELDDKEGSEAIFMIGKSNEQYSIMTGNYLYSDKVDGLKLKLDNINSLNKEELKSLYKEILNNDTYSEKGGGGLGIIDMARKSGEKLEYDFIRVDSTYSFFSLYIKIANQSKEK
jgi:hypothetical protein